MFCVPAFLRPVAAGLALFVTLAVASAATDGKSTASPVASPATDRKFTTSPTLSKEASTFVSLLEQAHYNHDAVRSSDYAQVVPDYMTELDGQHMFFLGTDKAAFAEKYGKSTYYNVRYLGNINAAYEMYDVFHSRVASRISWILEELNKDVDLTMDESYRVDRTKSEWPSTAADADDLWRKRIKFELVAELLYKTNDAKSKAEQKTTEAKSADADAPKVADDGKKAMDDAKQTIRKRYERTLKNFEDIDGSWLAETYLSTIAHLYDPHTTYFSADTFEDFAIQMKLSLVGIGALLGLEEDNCVVKEIVPGGPADLGRVLKPNDKIISVSQTNGEPVEIMGMKLRKIVEMIRGEKGTQVHLLVQPADATDSSTRKEIVITRDTVKLNSARARAAVFQVPGPDGQNQPLGVITLPAFYGPADDGDTDAEKTSASKDVERLIDQLKEQKVKGVVLDLRKNGGGYLNEAIQLAGLFINKGPVVQVKAYDGSIQVDNDENEGIAYGGPLAVLVDRFSASASEIVTGALQNYGRAIVVGDSSTHGKGSVQQVVEMKNLSPDLASSKEKTGATKFTIQKYYLPSGDSTQLKGVIPDIILPSKDDYIPNIGEADLPHALVWDKIPTSFFDGAPLSAKVLTPLRQASLDRQTKLDEFAYLRKDIEWFKVHQEQKLISLNLVERKKQKEADDVFRKEMKVEKDRIAKSDYVFKDFRLGPPAPPRIKAPKKDGEEDDDTDDLGDENDTYVKADVNLREALRIVQDAVELAKNKELWASNRPPLTASSGG